MPIDPAAALAVNIAVAPRTFAFFLGAGISRPAGIPSGSDVLLDTCRKYYVATNKSEPPDELDLVKWVEETLGSKVSYSDLLEMVFNRPELRQEYLRAFFEGAGKEPTEAHRSLARLAKGGWIKVFVTTNFDHLLERALTELDISWTRVSSSHELTTARPREHSSVYILKVHGDYEYSDIRNTSSELENLDPSIAEELREVLRHYGLVAIGYAADDSGVRKVLTSERARYGTYWLLHSAPPATQENLLQSLDARRMMGEANAFCADLELRIKALSELPDGRTPRAQWSEVVALIREGDHLGARVRIQELHGRLLQTILAVNQEGDQARKWNPYDRRCYRPIFRTFGPTVDAFCSAAIAAGEYQPDLIDYFMPSVVDLFGRNPSSSRGLIEHLPGFLAVLIGNTLLTAALVRKAWAMFVKVALQGDPNTRTAWTATPAFQDPPLFGDYMTSARSILEWAATSEALKVIMPPGEAARPYIIQANVLLSAVARQQTGYWRGWAYGEDHGKSVEPLFRRIAFDDSVASQLAPLAGGGTSGVSAVRLRQMLAHVYRRELTATMEGTRLYGDVEHVSNEVLGLLSDFDL